MLPAAWLADRTSRRTVIAAALSIWSAMTALGASGVLYFVAARFVRADLARLRASDSAA